MFFLSVLNPATARRMTDLSLGVILFKSSAQVDEAFLDGFELCIVVTIIEVDFKNSHVKFKTRLPDRGEK